jgi:putative membrane protein
LDLTAVGDTLAAINATLNATSAVALFSGYVLIRRKAVHAHRAAMVTALTASVLFFVFYLTRVSITGTHEFAGQGGARTAYFAILLSHMILAVLVLPFVIRLVYLVRHRRFHDHSRLARWVFPVWAYVSVTGLIVYLMLYRIYGYV